MRVCHTVGICLHNVLEFDWMTVSFVFNVYNHVFFTSLHVAYVSNKIIYFIKVSVELEHDKPDWIDGTKQINVQSNKHRHKGVTHSVLSLFYAIKLITLIAAQE